LSPTNVTRAIAALEKEVGAPLLIRTTRTVRLSEDGAAFLARARAALADLDEAFEAVGGGQEPRGTLTVTAPVMFGRLHVLPVVESLLRAYPDFRVRLLLIDRVGHLVEEGFDIAIRIGAPPDSALQMVRIGEVRLVFSASPSYLHVHGEPRSLAQLAGHDLIAIENETGAQPTWRLPYERHLLAMTPRLTLNSVDAAIAAATAGLGIVRTLSYQVGEHLADGRLQPVLTQEASPPLPVYLLFQSGRRDTPNIHAFVAAARRQMGANL
jgi:DNA-binding transcriptional LysR family regulator